MKTLTGTEKQIAWAEKIRSEYLKWFDLAVAELDDDINDEDNDAETIEELKKDKAELVAAFSAVIEQKDSASWWIDRRTTDPAVVAGNFYKPSYLPAIRRLLRK